MFLRALEGREREHAAAAQGRLGQGEVPLPVRMMRGSWETGHFWVVYASGSLGETREEIGGRSWACCRWSRSRPWRGL